MKHKKRLSCICMIVIISLSAFSNVFAKDATLKVNGLIQNFSVQPINEQNQIMVSSEELFGILNATVSKDDKAKSVTATNGDTTITLTEGSKAVVINDKTKNMTVSPKMANGKLMIPVRFVSEAFGAKVSYDKTSNVIGIETVDKKIGVLETKLPVTDETSVLSYDEALAKAIGTNSTLKNLSDSISYLEESRKATIENYNDAPQTGLIDTDVSFMRTVKSLEGQLRDVELNERITKETSEYLLRSYLTSIDKAVMDIQLLSEQITLTNDNINNLNLKLSVGMASDSEVKKAKQELEQSKIKLSSARLALKNEKVALNKLLGYATEKDVYVKYQPVINPVQVNIDAYVPGKVSDDPTIILKKAAVDQAEYEVNTSVSDLKNPELDQTKTINALNTATRDLFDAEKNMEKALRSAFITMQQLEENGKSLKIDLQKAKDDYNNAVANYQAGMITMYDVNQAKFMILTKEIDIEKNAYSYSNYAFAFERPYLLPSSGGSPE